MLKIDKIDVFLPNSPKNQVFDSLDIISYNSTKTKVKDDNFFNIINKKNTSHIRSAWKSSLLSNNYKYHSKNMFLLEIKSKKSFYRGILCGISSNILDNEIVIPHESVFKTRVKKLKKYLDIVKLQAEPVVFGANFSNQINLEIESSLKKKPIIDFDYKMINYSIRNFDLKDSINNFTKFFIVDGHHRTSSFKLFSKNSNKEYQLLTFLTDIGNIKSDKFTWQVTYPSKYLINSVKRLSKTKSRPNDNLFWAFYRNEYYIFNESELIDLNIINYEKWIVKHGDIIKRYHSYNRDENNFSNCIIFNYPTLSFNEIIDSINRSEIFPQKSTFLEPKMLTGFTINELV
jgi:uncharacterized protein (DUF1015 family)